MRKNLYFSIFVTVFTMLVFNSSVLLADDTTIVGEVDDQYQIISTGDEVNPDYNAESDPDENSEYDTESGYDVESGYDEESDPIEKSDYDEVYEE